VACVDRVVGIGTGRTIVGGLDAAGALEATTGVTAGFFGPHPESTNDEHARPRATPRGMPGCMPNR
jgi:hypothetical protein